MARKLIRVLVTMIEDDKRVTEYHLGTQGLALAVADYYEVDPGGLIQGLTSLIVRLKTEEMKKEVENGHHGTKVN